MRMSTVLLGALLTFMTATLYADNPALPIPGLDDSENPKNKVVSYETTGDKARLFRKEFIEFGELAPNVPTLTLDLNEKYQTIDGFGAAITGSTAVNLLKMSQEARTAFLTEAFSVDKGLGFSYVRVSIGCSDFSLSEYTHCDTPGIEHFEFAQEDRDYVVPVLLEILKINPELKIVASPWTCPKWMKVNNLKELKPFDSWTSGSLNPAYYDDYALYFVKYLQAMRDYGIEIDAITMQNEPLNRGNSASLFMTWQEQAEFVKKLGPALKNHGFQTKIWAFDHNFNYDNNKPECKDQWGYPLHIYDDPEASKYLDGAAYHAYGGNKEEMKRARDARPDKALYFTEQSIGEWNYSFGGDLMWFMREVGIGVINYDCKAIVVWNLMLDDKKGPNRPGGCQSCYGAVNISSRDYRYINRYSHYYELAHFAKVARTGAKRVKINADTPKNVYACAFLNPDQSRAIVLQNDSNENVKLNCACDNQIFTVELKPKSVKSLRWF